MTNIVALDNTAHGDLRLLTGFGPQFGDCVNQSPLLLTEFEEAQRHYPILFLKDPEGRLHANVILGFAPDENLFLDDDGSWNAYVPALFRRGPFLIGGLGENGDPVIHVDLDHPRVRRGGEEGMPVFLEHGGNALLLEACLMALRQVHIGAQAAQAFQGLVEEMDLLEETKLTAQTGENSGVNFEGFMTITHERLHKLEGPALEKLSKSGMLPAVVYAAGSVANMQRLITLKQKRSGLG